VVQCGAVWCSEFGVVCCSVTPRDAENARNICTFASWVCSVLQCVAVCCSVLQRVLQCVAVRVAVRHQDVLRTHTTPGYAPWCCSVLKWVPVCCSMVQRAAVWCSVLQFDTKRLWLGTLARMLPGAAVVQYFAVFAACIAVCCSVLQCGAVWCSVLQCVTGWCSVSQWVTVGCSVFQCRVLQYGAVHCSVAPVGCRALQQDTES